MIITPTGIAISFGGSASGRGDSRPVVARIYGFAAADDEGDPIIREMVVPAGQTVHEDLPHGLYNVQLRLPSGRVLQRNVTVDEESEAAYRFFEDFAPSSGFSLQDTVGLSGEQLLAEAAEGSTAPVAGAAIDTDMFKSAPLPVAAPVLAVHRGRGPSTAAAPDWSDPALDPDEMRGAAGLWHVCDYRVEAPNKDQRLWARVELPDGAVEIGSLPLPWYCNIGHEHSGAEILVDPDRTHGSAMTIAVRDTRLSGLLAYLDRGQAGMARALLEELERENVIEQAISAKASNPLAACAAAYVGLAVYDPREREVWDHWLGNCMNWFPDVPDGAIVHARRLILRPTGPEDNAHAADALRRACAAGIPYFSAGVSLLREMLLVLAADFPDLAEQAEHASRLASRVDPSQAFTVLRYPPPTAA